ncbi:PAS domain-containing protein [Pedobacter frigoris]|uniref:sensor histidine kinase n=1 Tax=Pedobacter frigoris TaxID=2571272 RepID=UPI00292D4115|nr:PAS domain-containing protein [Pedobacter frigoris]
MNLEKKLVVITEWLLNRPRVAGIFVFLFLILLIGLFTNQRYQIIKENEHREMNNMLNAAKQNIEQSLRNSYTSALTLALTINDKGEPDNFEAVAAQLMNSGMHFKAVQLVPDGLIKYIYPLKGNEKAVNSSVFGVSKENTYRAKASIKARKMYFLGPSRLLQGGKGIIGRLPLYRNNKFWGFSAVVIKLEAFLKDVGVDVSKNNAYYFQFSKVNVTDNKEEFYLPGSSDFSNKTYEKVSIPDGNWKLYIISNNKYSLLAQVISPSVFGIFLAILCSILVTQLLKRAEEKLLMESWVRIESLINTIDGIVWEAEPDNFEFTFISGKVQDILGYTPEEWLSSPTFWADHLHPEDKEWAVEFCMVNTKMNRQHDFEYRMIAKNGHIVWLRDIVNVISAEDKPILIRGIMIDIGESKRAAKALSDSFELVNEQNKRLLNFSYIVSHNLRSHTSNIQAISSLIEHTESEEERKEFIELMKTVSGSLNETLVNLNKVVNIQTSIDIIRDHLNLRDYIDRTINVLNDQIALKNATIINNVPADVNVHYNPAYLESILLNFIFNAIRYSHPERAPLIELSCLYEKDQLVLAVSDNGIGIDLEKHGHQLFGMYKTFNGNPDSKGVGLFISKNQIEAMGGKVTVESVINKCTTFKIYFK